MSRQINDAYGLVDNTCSLIIFCCQEIYRRYFGESASLYQENNLIHTII